MRMANATRQNLLIDSVTLLRVRSVQFMLGLIMLGSLFNGIILFASEEGLVEGSGLITVAATIISLGLLFLVHQQRYVTTIGTIAILYIIVISFFSFADQFDLLVMMFLLAVIGAAFAVPTGLYWFINVVVMTLLMGLIFAGDVDIIHDVERINENIALTVTIAFAMLPSVVGTIVRYVAQTLESSTTDAQRTATLLEASANIGQSVSQMLHLHDLLVHSAQIIRDRFAFYHVQIFLVNDAFTVANLVASPGEIGEKLLQREFSAPIDASNVIGRVILSKEAIIARHTDHDRTAQRDDLLGDTRSQLAIPIQENEEVIGVIDLYSRVPNAFTTTEMRVLTVIANQLATAIRNARLFERQSENLSENKRLFIESEANLREIQRLNRQLTRQAWSDYLQSHRRVSGILYDGEDFRDKADWTSQMQDASRRRRPITHDEQGRRTVSVPIELRGEVIGAIEIETQHTEHQDDSIDLMQAISQRLAVSLDNARLFEETQEATAQEQRVGELVAQFQSAGTVDELLQITLRGLRETLGAEAASIRLGFLAETLDQAISTEGQATTTKGSSA